MVRHLDCFQYFNIINTSRTSQFHYASSCSHTGTDLPYSQVQASTYSFTHSLPQLSPPPNQISLSFFSESSGRWQILQFLYSLGNYTLSVRHYVWHTYGDILPLLPRAVPAVYCQELFPDRLLVYRRGERVGEYSGPCTTRTQPFTPRSCSAWMWSLT